LHAPGARCASWRRSSACRTPAQIRVRGAFLLLAAFVVLASSLGLEAILGAFLAGAILKLVDRDEEMDLISAANAAAVIAAGLLSVLLFPLAALALLRSAGQPQRQPAAAAAPN
jgi:hypothetical protein